MDMSEYSNFFTFFFIEFVAQRHGVKFKSSHGLFPLKSYEKHTIWISTSTYKSPNIRSIKHSARARVMINESWCEEVEGLRWERANDVCMHRKWWFFEVTGIRYCERHHRTRFFSFARWATISRNLFLQTLLPFITIFTTRHSMIQQWQSFTSFTPKITTIKSFSG